MVEIKIVRPTAVILNLITNIQFITLFISYKIIIKQIYTVNCNIHT